MRSCVVIVACCILISLLYAPAVNRVFVADQILYMAETSGRRSFAEKLSLLDFELSRKYWRGEEKLFRPLTILTLGVERHFLEGHHRAWNVANIFFHLLATLLLYRLLTGIDAKGFAGPLALLFGVMRSNAELVTWNHLGGYIFGFTCLLASWRLLLDAMHERPGRAWEIRYVLGMTAAAFFYEPNAVFCFILGIFACIFMVPGREIMKHKGYTVPLFLPVAVFTMAYGYHAMKAERFFGGAAALRADAVTLAGLPKAIGVMASSFLVEGVLPAAVRIRIEAFQRFEIAFPGASSSPEFVFNATALLFLLAAVVPALGRGISRVRLLTAGGAACMILAFLAIITLGRTVDNARENTYYAYLFNLLSVIGVCALINPEKLSERRRRCVAAGILLFAIVQAGQLFGVTRQIRSVNREADGYFSTLNDFVNAHRSERGFTFQLDGEPPIRLDPPFKLTIGYFDDPSAEVEEKRLSRIIHETWWRDDAARYALRWTEDRWDISAHE